MHRICNKEDGSQIYLPPFAELQKKDTIHYAPTRDTKNICLLIKRQVRRLSNDFILIY